MTKKIDFVDLLKDAKSVADHSFSLPVSFESDGMEPHKHDLVAKAVFQNGGRGEFLQDSGHFRGLNFGEWKSGMLTCCR